MREVGRQSVDRGLVELDVAGVHDGPVRRVEAERATVRDRVGDLDDFDGERCVLHRGADGDLSQVGLRDVGPLTQDGRDERERQLGPIDRQAAAEVAQQVGQRTDVVEVAMGEEDRFHVIPALQQPTPVGQDEIHTEVLGVREEHTDVDDGDPAIDLDGRHVATDLPESTEESDLHGWMGCRVTSSGRSGVRHRRSGHVVVDGASGRASGLRCVRSSKGHPAAHPQW